MEAIIGLIQNWGYLIVLLGAMVEGESVILTACFMAYLGYLSLGKIMLIAFAGTLFADQLLYYVGRYYGKPLLERHPKWHIRVQKVFRLLNKWDVWFILSFRFIYGIRTISPIVIGSAGITPRRFIPLNILAATIWTIVSCSAGYLIGYLFGDSLISLFNDSPYLKLLFIFVPLVVIICIFAYLRRHIKKEE